MVFRGLVRYGFVEDARELAHKTIALFGLGPEKSGALHEYYQPENGAPLLNIGFQNWNYLVPQHDRLAERRTGGRRIPERSAANGEIRTV